MDKSVGSSCSEIKSPATQTEDPLMTLVANLQLEDDKNTTPTSPIKESGTMQDEDDDSNCSTPMQPPTTPSKNSLPLKTSSSNPMDTSIETTYSKTPSADSTTEDSVMTAGDECNTMDTSSASTSHDIRIEGSRIPLEDDANRIDQRSENLSGADTSPACPAGGPAIMSGEDSNSRQIGTEYPQYHTFHSRVENRTDIKFNKAESALLNKYLKFIIEPKFNRNLAVELLSDATLAGEDLKPNKRWRAKYELWDVIENELENKKNSMINQKFRAYKSTIESINEKLKGKAVARKADEDDFIVIITVKEYTDKTKLYFDKDCICEINDITNDFQSEIDEYLKDECSFLEENGKNQCRIKYPTAPDLTFLIKVDKDDISIRPFINTENSPAYELTKKLDKLLRDNYVFCNKYSVSSSMALIRKIKDMQITKSSRLVSLGIKNLYDNVPVDTTIDIVATNLINNEKVSEDTRQEIVKLLKIVAKYNYFRYNNNFFKQNNALTLGSSLSDTLAEIFINDLEQTILEDDNLKEKVYYGRIVDKILLVVNSTDDIHNICRTFSIKSNNKIDFSIEMERNNCIQFLDLNITRLGNQLTFKVFRKSTATDVVIPSDSCHPQKDKERAFRSLLDRAYKMPMSEEDRLYELNIIKQIAHSNGYEMDMVDLLWDDVRRNNEAEQINVEKKTVTRNNEAEQINVEKKTVTVPYYGKLSEKLADIFKPYNVTFDFQAINFMEMFLSIDLGYRNRISEQSGVYKFKCTAENCFRKYIGETDRTFLVRCSEQENNKASPVYNHMSATGHSLESRVLHIEMENKRRELLEKFQIAIHDVKNDCKLLNTKINNNIKFFFGFVELFEDYYRSKTLSHPTN